MNSERDCDFWDWDYNSYAVNVWDTFNVSDYVALARPLPRLPTRLRPSTTPRCRPT